MNSSPINIKHSNCEKNWVLATYSDLLMNVQGYPQRIRLQTSERLYSVCILKFITPCNFKLSCFFAKTSNKPSKDYLQSRRLISTMGLSYLNSFRSSLQSHPLWVSLQFNVEDFWYFKLWMKFEILKVYTISFQKWKFKFVANLSYPFKCRLPTKSLIDPNLKPNNRFKSNINIVVVVFSKFRTFIALPAFYNISKKGISNKILEIKNCIKVGRIIMKVVR